MSRFKKNERLCSKKLIQLLFAQGQSFLVYPIKVTFLFHQGETLLPKAQVLILVSRKRFRKAVYRNRIKRLLREAYRLEKDQFYKHLNYDDSNCLIALSYVANDELVFSEIRKSVELALKKIIEHHTHGV